MGLQRPRIAILQDEVSSTKATTQAKGIAALNELNSALLVKTFFMINKNTIPGIIGMVLTIGAILSQDLQAQRWLFLVGAFGMSITAAMERHRMFIGLQMIVLTGTLAAFLPLATSAKAFLPLAVSVPVLFILAGRRMLSTSNARFGALALVILSIGYATQSALGFFIGGGLVSLYSAIEFKSGFKPAIIWLVLNLAFTCLAGAKLALTLF